MVLGEIRRWATCKTDPALDCWAAIDVFFHFDWRLRVAVYYSLWADLRAGLQVGLRAGLLGSQLTNILHIKSVFMSN
jgi:hypothetical protein